MICVYPAACTDFSGNGLGVVRPQSCTVTETLNGEWELTREMDTAERGQHSARTSTRCHDTASPNFRARRRYTSGCVSSGYGYA